MNVIKRFLTFIGVVALWRLITNAISGTMAATDLISVRDAIVELDIGGVDTWVQVETWANMVEPTRGTVPTTEEKALDGTNFTGYGNPGNATVRFTGFATKDTTDPLYNLYSQLGEIVDIRWAKDASANTLRWYTSQGVLTECNPPSADANSNQSTKFSAVITASDISMEVIST